MTFVRYSTKPLIATVNPAHDGVLEPFELAIGQRTFENDDYIYEVDWSNRYPSISTIDVKNDIHLLAMNFKPAFPCLDAFPENTTFKGRFRISGHESVGSISGEYHIQSGDGSIAIRLVPVKGWKPKATKFSTRFLFTVAKVFKKWPTTYQWDAALHKDQEGVWHMQSQWIRTGRIMAD